MANLLSNTTIGGYQSIHTGNIGSYALTSLPSHNHDDRYYTEGESDGRYAYKAGAAGQDFSADRLSSYYLRNHYGVSTDHSYGMYFDNGLSSSYGIYRESGAWDHPYPDLRIAFHTGIKLGANSSYNGIRFYTDYDMTTQVMSVNNGSDGLGGGNVYVNNSLQAGSSLRAPIFYDSEDTNYYVDPNSSSKLSSLGLGGISPDARLSVSGDTHISGYIYQGGNAAASSSWGSRTLVSSGNYTTNANTFRFDNLGYGTTWDVRFDSSGAHASHSFRAPIFYDSNDTNYYGDFAGFSYLNQLGLASFQYIGGQTSNGQSNYQWDGADYRNPDQWTARLILRRDNATTGINGSIPSLVIFNNNGADQTTASMVFATNECVTGSNSVNLAGIIAKKESVGNCGGWSAGSLNFFVKNFGARVDSLALTPDGNATFSGIVYSTGYGNSSQWNTSYSWGNHASAGYQSASTAITTSNIGSQSVTNSAQLNGLSKIQLWNNSGQGHSTYQTFGAIPNFGVWFMQNSSAGDTPQSGSQYYVQTQGLGSEYGYGTAGGNYALMTAVARDHARKYTYYRTLENGGWGSWTKGAAGYADEAAVLSSMNISQFTNNSGYLTGITSGQVTGALGYTPYNSSNPSGYITSGDTTTGIFTTFLGNATSNISSGYTRVIRNENGAGGAPNYAPILHVAASDTMWQIAGAHAGQTTLVWRSGYSGAWNTPWWTIYHSGNFTDNSSNWNTAFGWGNHASAGYLTSGSLSGYATQSYVNSQGFLTSVPAQSQLISPNGGTVVAADAAMPNAGHSFIHSLALGPGGNDGHILGMTWAGTTSSYGAQIFIDTDPNDIFAIRSRSSGGVWTSWKTVYHNGNFTDNSSNWNTAYSWGNHASAGYLTSLPSHNHDDRYYTETESDSRYLYYRGYSTSGNTQNFQSTANTIRFDQVGALDNGAWSNQPTGYYTYGGILSLRGDSFGLQIYGSHTGDLVFKTQWDNDQYSGWRTVIHSANIGSQSVSYASTAGSAPANGGNSATVGGYSVSVGASANTIPTRNASGYLIPESWIQLNGIYGLYSPTNGAHLRPNSGSYGSWQMTGSRNGWQGIEFDSGSGGNISLMVAADSNTVGFHNNNYGWQFRWNGGTLYVYKNAYGAGTEATVLDSSNYSSWAQPIASAINTGNIGSQSVSYASTAGSLSSMNISQFTNNSGYLTGITSGQVTGALGYTPYNSSNPSGYITSSGSISGNAATATYATTAGSAPNGSNINQFYNVSAGVGNGLSFWNGSSAYKISMGVGSLYQYGPVSDYSIKMQMNDGDTGRGFTWGRESYAPIAALNSTSGDMEVAGYYKSYGYRGNGNVGGTGNASWHPDGIYCGSTMWQYGAQYKNNTGIYDVSEFKLYSGPTLSTYNTRNLIVRALDNDADVGILGQKSGGGFAFQIYGTGSSYGFLNGIWAAWDIRKAVNGAMYMNDNDSYYLQTNSTSNFYALNIQGSAVIHAGNIGSQSVSYASSAGSVAWTNVSSRPTALSQFTNDLGNYGGWITSSGSISGSAGSVPASGITGQAGMWTSSNRPGASKLYRNDSDDAYNVQTTWSADKLGYWSLRGYYNDSYHAPCYVASSGFADNAGQLNTYGYLIGDNWNTYYTSGKLRVASVSGSASVGAPPNVHNYGSLVSYGISGEDMFQMYFPDNAGNSIANSRKLTYRTGRTTWCDWRTVVDMVGDTLTIVEGANPKIVVRGGAAYPNPTSASIELVGDADNNQTKSYRWISTAPDWSGQDLRLERYSINGGYQLVGRVPKNTSNLEWQGTIVQGLSDSRVKTNVVSMTGGLDKIDRIRPVTFDWVPTEDVSDREGADFGFIAQELEEVLPEVVHTRGDGYKTVMYEKVVPVLVQAMKEQQAMIDILKAEIELLKNR